MCANRSLHNFKYIFIYLNILFYHPIPWCKTVWTPG